MRRSRINLLLILAAVVVFGVGLAVGTSRGQFGGTDAAASQQLTADGYRPWFEPLWAQPGGEVESGLFALQAAIGGGILGFALGTFRERRKRVGDTIPSRYLPGEQPGDGAAAKT